MTTTRNLYDRDFYLWTQRQAELLRLGLLSDLDIENLAEEIESMGKRDRRERGRSDLFLVKKQESGSRKGSGSDFNHSDSFFRFGGTRFAFP